MPPAASGPVHGRSQSTLRRSSRCSTPLPTEPFETARSLGCGGPPQPDHAADQPLLGIGAADRPPGAGHAARSELVVYDGHGEVARQERLIAKAGVHLSWTTT
jgi:hypothetical protein